MGDFVSFAQSVHDAFGRLYDRVYLKDHPLTRALFGDGPVAIERVHRTLIDSLEWLRPLGDESPRHAEWRRYRHLQLRYVEGATPEQIARELLVSARQARRDHAEALDELARLLWERFVPSASPPMTSPVITRPTPASRSGDLESELSIIVASDRPMPTQLGEVLQGVLDTARQLAEAHQVQVNVRLEPQLPSAEISRPILRQLLLNLLADAIVRHPGSTVEVHASRSTDVVDIAVQALAAGDTATSLVTQQCLDLVRRLARSQNVVVQSGAAASGLDDVLSVILRLPASSVRSLLLVDDNPDVGLLFRRFLSDSSFRLVQARSAEKALRLAREIQPDVVVLDLLLPSTDGWEVLQALRADPATVDLPIIISSVLPDHAIAQSLGVTDFLPKPVTQAALQKTLSQLPIRASRGILAPGQPVASG
jgi:CheY-like chemotaxis protein